MTLSADELNLHDMILAYYQDFLKHVPELFVPRDK